MSLLPPPRTLDEVHAVLDSSNYSGSLKDSEADLNDFLSRLKACFCRRLLQRNANVETLRAQLSGNILQTHAIGRDKAKASILLIGESGVGKSSTINHLFGLSEELSGPFVNTNNFHSETRATTEYVIEVDSRKRFCTTGLKLAVVDTPGFGDDDGLKQDACNLNSIKTFFNGIIPNLVLVLVKSTDNRIAGKNKCLAKSMKFLKASGLVDTEHQNVVAVVTWSTSLGEREVKYTKNIKDKKKIVNQAIFEVLGMDVPVVAIENEFKYLKKDGEFTVLPDKTRQVKNLYLACQLVMMKNGDYYGHLIFNEAFNHGKKTVSCGKSVPAKDAEKDQLSNEEIKLFDLISNEEALVGEILDPLNHNFKEFMEKENMSEDDEDRTEIIALVSLLKTMGVRDLKDLEHISVRGLRFKHQKEISYAGKKFLNKVGLVDTIHKFDKASAAVITQGYNILTDTTLPSQIYSYEEVDTKYGIAIPAPAKLIPVNKTQEFMKSFNSKEELIKERLSQLNVSLNVDHKKLNFGPKAGLNLIASTSTGKDAIGGNKNVSFYVEERIFELNMGNFMDNGIVLTADFINAVKKLPQTYDVTESQNRSDFEQFFNRWGHYVVTKAIGGGSVELQVNASSFTNTDFDYIKNCLMTSVKAGFLNTDASAGLSYGSSQTVNAQKIFDSSTTKWSGGARELHINETIKDKHKMNNWRNSLLTSPTILTTDMVLEPISTLVELADNSKSTAVYECLKDILGGEFDEVAKRLKKFKEAERAAESHKQEQKEANTREGVTVNTPKNNNSCIHLDSTAEVLRAGKKKTLKLKELVVGDVILGYDTKKKTPVYTKLIMWAHTDTITPTKYLHFELEDDSEIKLTAEHMIMVGQLYHAKMAKHVEIGNLLYKKNVGFLKVLKISQVIEVGFCCPITDSGNIMVNGILTSCFAHLSDISIFGKTFISAQTIGRVGFLPFMAYRKMLKDDGKAMNDKG